MQLRASIPFNYRFSYGLPVVFLKTSSLNFDIGPFLGASIERVIARPSADYVVGLPNRSGVYPQTDKYLSIVNSARNDRICTDSFRSVIYTSSCYVGRVK